MKKNIIDFISNLILIDERNLFLDNIKELYFKKTKMNERYTL